MYETVAFAAIYETAWCCKVCIARFHRPEKMISLLVWHFDAKQTKNDSDECKTA